MTLTAKLAEIKGIMSKATQVVAWYPHPAEVRGPFNRWLTVSKVMPEYERHVASRADDAAYAAMAMNMLPVFVKALELMEDQFAALEHYLMRAKNESQDAGLVESCADICLLSMQDTRAELVSILEGKDE